MNTPIIEPHPYIVTCGVQTSRHASVESAYDAAKGFVREWRAVGQCRAATITYRDGTNLGEVRPENVS